MFDFIKMANQYKVSIEFFLIYILHKAYVSLRGLHYYTTYVVFLLVQNYTIRKLRIKFTVHCTSSTSHKVTFSKPL